MLHWRVSKGLVGAHLGRIMGRPGKMSFLNYHGWLSKPKAVDLEV